MPGSPRRPKASQASPLRPQKQAASPIPGPPRAIQIVRRFSRALPARFNGTRMRLRAVQGRQWIDQYRERYRTARQEKSSQPQHMSVRHSRPPSTQHLSDCAIPPRPKCPPNRRLPVPNISAAGTAAISPEETFTALDGGTSLGSPTWIHAGGQHAEAGFRDPALGWVGVRADLGAGGIHATLVPNSADAAQALNGHLAGLSAHLTEQQASLASLSMASPSDNGIENSMGQRMQQGAQGDPQSSASEESQTRSHENTPPAFTTSNLVTAAPGAVPETMTYTGELRGTRISVMA